LRFIQTQPFSKAWDRLGLTDDDLRVLELSLASNPDLGPVVAGTGGLRKARFAAKGSARGKRGSYRIGYVHYEEHYVFVLVAAYDKTEKADLSPDDKKFIRTYIRSFQKELEEGL
jgi:hypothetical protein